jgi:hypothetical protein
VLQRIRTFVGQHKRLPEVADLRGFHRDLDMAPSPFSDFAE